MSSATRLQRLKDVRGHGVGTIPQKVHAVLDSDVVHQSLYDWPWISIVWDRPTRHNWPYREEDLVRAQEAWDASAEHVERSNEAAARLEARKAQDRAAQETKELERQKEAEARTREELRMKFLRNPSATEEDFERLYPQLRDEHLMREAEQAESQARDEMRARIRANF